MSRAQMPPFASVLKSRDVEDPVNLWLHRPLAYLFAASVFRTPMTPNQITLLSTIVGVSSLPLYVVGTPATMVAAGLCVWLAAILDGADGILARAKGISSDLGRALDGVADVVVSAASVLGAAYHLWIQTQSWLLMAAIPVTAVSTVLHVYMYDYYKEWYMMMSREDWDGRPEMIRDVEERLERLESERASWLAIFVTRTYLTLITRQTRVVRWTNIAGLREGRCFIVNDDTRDDYRRFNRPVVKLWSFISSAPHCYLFAIATMIDRVDYYIWVRLVFGNLLFVILLVWQRAASRRTLAAWRDRGAEPVPAT